MIPRVTSATNITIRRVLVDAALPTFTSSGIILFDYKVNGKPWTGVATIGTDDPSKYSNFLWNLSLLRNRRARRIRPLRGRRLVAGVEELGPKRCDRGAHQELARPDQRDEPDLAEHERIPLEDR